MIPCEQAPPQDFQKNLLERIIENTKGGNLAFWRYCECSACGHMDLKRPSVCPNCGKEMLPLDSELIDIILTYAACDMQGKRVVQEFGIHKNTVYNRLAKVKQLTGLDPRKFYDLYKLLKIIRITIKEADA